MTHGFKRQMVGTGAARRRGVFRVGALLACALACASAWAEGNYFYGALGGSVADIDRNSFDGAVAAAGATGITSGVSETDPAGKIQLGRMFTPNFGIEGGWVRLGRFTHQADFTGPAAGRSSTRIEVSGINVAGIGVLPLRGDVSAVARLGAIGARVQTVRSGTVGANSLAFDDTHTSWRWSYGLGLQYAVSPLLTVRTEWERFDGLGGRGDTGRGDVDLWSIGLMVGF